MKLMTVVMQSVAAARAHRSALYVLACTATDDIRCAEGPCITGVEASERPGGAMFQRPRAQAAGCLHVCLLGSVVFVCGTEGMRASHAIGTPSEWNG